MTVKRHGDLRLDRAAEDVRDAIRHLSPREAVRVLRETAEEVEMLARKYEEGLL
jgi:hypothetical protein